MQSKPNRMRCAAEVVDARAITPHLRRITITGPDLRTLAIDRPAQWVKIFFPDDHGFSKAGRAYTIRAFDPVNAVMDLEFALHGDNGPASRWAARARRGDRIEVAGPRSGHAIDPAAEHYILVGDATALPAIAAILEALPATVHARAFLEVTDAAERQAFTTRARLEATWLHSGNEAPGTTGQLELAIQAAQFETRNCQVWIAGESFMVRSVRTHLMLDRGITEAAIDAKGYWKLGVADARD